MHNELLSGMSPYPRTRFAPSPTGRLHLGHAYAAWFAWAEGGGEMVLRIEDIDRDRCRPEYEAAILEDLAWLGLWNDGEFYRQTDSATAHARAIERLREKGLVYPCFCTRRDIAESASAPHGAEGPIYPGTCRGLADDLVADRIALGVPFVLRLDVQRAMLGSGELKWFDRAAGEQVADPAIFGDVVLVRKFDLFSYHLCCVVDDASQGIGLVTRGQDLFSATHVHRLLQEVLGLPVPVYHHHGLVVDEHGVRLAKRADSLSIHALRASGWQAGELLNEARRRVA
jgi:glutamyl-Q tRNA(Asp) synthetase